MTERVQLEQGIKALTPRLAAQLPKLKEMMQNLTTHAAVTRHGDPEFEEARKNYLHILEGLIRFSQTNFHNGQLLYKINAEAINLVQLMKEEVKGLVELHRAVSRFTVQNSREEVPKIHAIITRLETIYTTEVKLVQAFDKAEGINAA
ncbi:hypothetical protein HZC31_04420 [Candidatus Woesearchaeota archaeon]|nr:hypothetical protein [Candidatus Woesearchaeota archaeon]